MARKRRSPAPQSNRGSGTRRAVGAAGAVSAFLAFGMAPPAHADFGLEDLLDPAAWGTLLDGDWGGDLDWDQLFAGDDITGALTASYADTGSAAATFGDPFGITGLLDQWVYEPLHDGMVAWINDPLIGKPVDDFINTWFGFGTIIIGNGAAGTEADPDGGDAGWLFGDGGAGY